MGVTDLCQQFADGAGTELVEVFNLFLKASFGSKCSRRDAVPMLANYRIGDRIEIIR